MRALLVAAALLGLVAPPAAAHDDLPVEGRHDLPAGGRLVLPVELHYHRVVGRVQSDGDVALRLAGPDGERALAGPGRDFAVNELVRCCKGESWTTFGLVVAPAGPGGARVDLRLRAVHDGVAVLSDNAESAAVETPALLFAGAWAVFGLRRGGLAPDPARAAAWAGRAALLLAALWGSAALFALWGMARFGGSPVAATVAATADLPRTGNPILNTHAFVTLLFVALFVAAAFAWWEAARRDPTPRGRTSAVGLALGGGAIVACAAWGIEYDVLAAPAVIAAAAGAFPLWIVGRRLRAATPG